MSVRFPIIIVLLLIDPSIASAVNLREACKELLKSDKQKSSFDLEAFATKFQGTPFADKNGDSFWFSAPVKRPGGFVVHTSIAYSGGPKVGSQGSRFSGLMINNRGDVDLTRTYIDYGSHQNRGILSAMFRFFKNNLPVGVALNINEVNSRKLIKAIHQVSNQDLMIFAKQNARGVVLYQLYLQQLKMLSSTRPSDPKHFGFRAYLLDLFSQWGRIARKANFRRDYHSKNPALSTSTYIKREIPDELNKTEVMMAKEAAPDFYDLLEKVGFKERYQR